MSESQFRQALREILDTLSELQSRLTRMETRLVKFMNANNVDHQGNPLDQATKTK